MTCLPSYQNLIISVSALHPILFYNLSLTLWLLICSYSLLIISTPSQPLLLLLLPIIPTNPDLGWECISKQVCGPLLRTWHEFDYSTNMILLTGLEWSLGVCSTTSSHPQMFQPQKILLTKEISHGPLIRVELCDVQTPPNPNPMLTIWTTSLQWIWSGHLHIV